MDDAAFGHSGPYGDALQYWGRSLMSMNAFFVLHLNVIMHSWEWMMQIALNESTLQTCWDQIVCNCQWPQQQAILTFEDSRPTQHQWMSVPLTKRFITNGLWKLLFGICSSLCRLCDCYAWLWWQHDSSRTLFQRHCSIFPLFSPCDDDYHIFITPV